MKRTENSTGVFLDARTLTAGVGTRVSTGHTVIHLKSVGFGSYMALLQTTTADLRNVEASKAIRKVNSEMKHSV